MPPAPAHCHPADHSPISSPSPQYLSTEGNVVKGTHTTPVKMYVDDLEFTFTDGGDGTCAMHVSSLMHLLHLSIAINDALI